MNWQEKLGGIRAARREKLSAATPMVPGQHRIVCPFCHSPDETMTVTRVVSGDVSGICFRASCSTRVGNPAGTARKTEKEPRYYTRATNGLVPEQYSWFRDRFGLTEDTVVDIRYNRKTDRFVLPVYGLPSVRGRGYIAYSFNESPKTLIYNERPNEPFMHYSASRLRPGDTLVVVEDWFSAEKVFQAAPGSAVGVALMGTYLSDDMANELLSHKLPIVVALDRDAWAKSIKMRDRLGDRAKVWRLDRDLKYGSEQRILEALDGHTDFIGTPDSQRNHQG